MNGYIPITEKEKIEMLEAIGVGDVQELFTDIPEKLKLKGRLNLPVAVSELELYSHMKALASKNISADSHICFMGGGIYDHFIPAVVDQVLSRQEFYTAYTPYQAEISQGTLQAIFEYQTMICQLTGMDVSNASLYDGATACAEAMLLAHAATGRNEIVIAGSINGEYLEVCQTYARFKNLTIHVTPYNTNTGTVDISELAGYVTDNCAAVIVQNPNYFGCIEDLAEIGKIVKAKASLFVTCVDPISLGMFETPASYGADIVVGEGQGMGSPMNFGGPGFGFFACKSEYMRKMPGRIVGKTTDAAGNCGFVLTIQAREQHIRREKATSNICSNQALCALAATVYLGAMGRKGFVEVAQLSASKAHYMFGELIKTGQFEPVFEGEFFKEFTIRYKGDVDKYMDVMFENGFMPGIRLESHPGCLLIAVTEKRTKAEIDKYVRKVGELI